jgi:hypothetical protein
LNVSETNERRLGLFDLKVVRCVFGAKQENGTWRKRYNYELYEKLNKLNIVNYIKIKILAWLGHLVFIDNNKTIKKY